MYNILKSNTKLRWSVKPPDIGKILRMVQGPRKLDLCMMQEIVLKIARNISAFLLHKYYSKSLYRAFEC